MYTGKYNATANADFISLCMMFMPVLYQPTEKLVLSLPVNVMWLSLVLQLGLPQSSVCKGTVSWFVFSFCKHTDGHKIILLEFWSSSCFCDVICYLNRTVSNHSLWKSVEFVRVFETNLFLRFWWEVVINFITCHNLVLRKKLSFPIKVSNDLIFTFSLTSTM